MSATLLEYFIRRYERGLRVLIQVNTSRHEILEYAKKISLLKKQLYNQYGYCSPRSPKWPI